MEYTIRKKKKEVDENEKHFYSSQRPIYTQRRQICKIGGANTGSYWIHLYLYLGSLFSFLFSAFGAAADNYH